MSELDGTSKGTNMPHLPCLREVWEIYIQAVKSQNQSASNVEKQSSLLDLLLCLCAKEMKHGPLPNFSDMTGVCKQMYKEFMSDVLHITSHSEHDDVTQLQTYLLQGRGWLMLQILYEKGPQDVSISRDFSNLLVRLLPLILKFPLRSSSNDDIDPSSYENISPITTSFQNTLMKKKSKQQSTQQQSLQLKRNSSYSSQTLEKNLSETISGKKKFSKRKSCDSKESKTEGTDEEDDDEKAEKVRKLRKKFRYCSMQSAGEKNIQNQAGSDSDDDEDLAVLLKSVNVQDQMITSGFHLCVLVLSILRELCERDLAEKQGGKLVSLSSLPDLMQCMKLLDTENIRVHSEWEMHAKQVLKLYLLRVIILCSGIASCQQNGLSVLQGHNVFEDILSSACGLEILKIDVLSIELLSQHKTEMHIVSDMALGFLLILTQMFENLPFNPSSTQTALYLVEEYEENKGFQMFKKCVLVRDWLKKELHEKYESFNWLEDEPISVLNAFLNTLKMVRVNYVHSMKCVKRRHNSCSYAEYFDHHHDTLGVAVGSRSADTLEHFTWQSQQPRLPHTGLMSQKSHQVTCLVASCTRFLLDLLVKVSSKITRLELLKTLNTSGVCCCMQLDDIVSAFVVGLQTFSPAVASFCAETLNKIILKQFSGKAFVPHEGLCSFCDESKTSEQIMQDADGEKIVTEKEMDSGIDASDVNFDLKFSSHLMLSKWSAISRLKPLLFSHNETLAVTLAKHLLVLAIKGNPFLKAELFFSLYIYAMELSNDTLIVNKNSAQSVIDTHEQGSVGHKEGIKDTENVSVTGDYRETEKVTILKSVQVNCLSALPFLLQANSVSKVFLSNKGVQKLCEQLEDETLRMPVLKIFEALVIMDEHQFCKSQEVPRSSCLFPYKGGRVIDAFILELSKRSFNESDVYIDDSCISTQRRIRRDSIVLSKFSLPVLVNLWNTCAKLCLHSHVFVAKFKEQHCLAKTEALLLETLDVVMNPNLIGPLKSHGSTEAEDSGMEGEPNTELENGCQESFLLRVSLLEHLMCTIGAATLAQDMNYTDLKIWRKVLERFSHSPRLEATKLKSILDAVMEAAMPLFIPLLAFSFSKNIALVYSGEDDVYDEDEVRLLLQSGTDDDNDVQTEHAYDADSEDTSTGVTEKGNHSRQPLKSGSSQKMYIPLTFVLLFDILIKLHEDRAWEGIVASVFHKLLQNARMDGNMAIELSSQGILSTILDEKGFWPTLLRYDADSPCLVQEHLLALVEQLGQQRLESHDLQRLHQLFQLSDIPMEKLLPVFLTVVKNAQVRPQHYVTFPARSLPNPRDSREDLLDSGTQGTLTSNLSPLIQSMRSVFLVAAPQAEMAVASPFEQEVWSKCALKLNLHDSLTWPPFQTGLTLTMWMCLENRALHRQGPNLHMYDLELGDRFTTVGEEVTPPPGHMTGCLHVVSIGTREKMLEVWTAVASGSLIFRLTSECSDTGLVVQESTLTGVLPPVTWQHLAISYLEELDGSTLTGKVDLLLDGWQSHSFVLDHPFAAIRSRPKSAQLPAFLCVGHVVSDPHISQLGNWSVGQMMVFKGASLPKDALFHLYTLGPNNRSTLKCDSSPARGSYAPHLHKNVVAHSRIPYEKLVQNHAMDLRNLRQYLIFSYDPRKGPAVFFEYQIIGKHELPVNQLTSNDPMLTQQAKVVTPVCQGHLHSNGFTDLEKAVDGSGGIASFLFLVAKVYEKCPESFPGNQLSPTRVEQAQAEVLRVLLSVIQHSSHLHQEYTSLQGHDLLCKVLTSSRSVPGLLILKVLFDAATTETLFKTTLSTLELNLKPRTDTVIRDISIIEHLILDWRIWESSAGFMGSKGVMEVVFAALANLVSEEHPYQEYNIKHFVAINIVSKIFKIYQERIQDGFHALPISVSGHVISIIQNLSGSPPDSHLITEICHFLLLAHPAAFTYINHMRMSFYFNLPWTQPDAVPGLRWRVGQMMALEGDALPSHSTPIKMGFSGNEDPDIVSTISSMRHLGPEFESAVPEKAQEAIASQQDGGSNLATGDKSHSEMLIDKSYGKTTTAESENDFIELKTMETNSEQAGGKTNFETAFFSDDKDLRDMEPHDTSLKLSPRIPENFETLYKSVTEEEASYLDDVEKNTDIDEDFQVIETDTQPEDSIASEENAKNMSLNFDDENAEMVKQEEGLTALCVGLLRHLSSLIQIMPDKMVDEMFCTLAINPHIFIVLAQNSSSEVRDSCIQVLWQYLKRSSSSELEPFFKMEGFHLLAAQLFQFPTHTSQMETAFSILMQRKFNIDDGFYPEEVIEDVGRIQQGAVPLVLGLLGNCTGDLALCHNSLQLCCGLFERSDVISVMMMEQGLLEVLANMLVTLLQTRSRNTDVEGMDENEILVTDLRDFFKVIALKEFSSKGDEHYLQFEGVLLLLLHMEYRWIQTQGIDSKEVKAVRTIVYHVVVAILDLVEKTSEEISQQSFSLFSKPATSLRQRSSQSVSYALTPPASRPPLLPRRTFSTHPNVFFAPGFLAQSHLSARKKTPGSNLHADLPYGAETIMTSGSGGDSDSGLYDSATSGSAHTVNIPPANTKVKRATSLDVSKGRVIQRSDSLLQAVLSQIGKKKKQATEPISQSDLIDRLKKVVTFATDITMFSERKPQKEHRRLLLLQIPAESIEGGFLKRLFSFLYRAFEATMPQDKSFNTGGKKTKNVIMWGAKDVLRVQLGRLLSSMLSDRQDFVHRVWVVAFIAGEPCMQEILRLLVNTPDWGNELAFHLYDLLKHHSGSLSQQQVEDGSRLINLLSSMRCEVWSPSAKLSAIELERLQERKKLMAEYWEGQAKDWFKKVKSLSRRHRQFDILATRLTESAMEVTQTVTQIQTSLRKRFIEYIRQKKTTGIQVKKQWQDVVQNLTHERALWHDPASYPLSWQLNPTEGPSRVRKRLQRGHLGIKSKFLKKELQHKLASETVDPPLVYLFEDDHQISDSLALIYQLHRNKKIRFTSTCRAVSPIGESKGELLIGEDSVYFVADEAISDANYTQVLLGNRDQLSMTWPFEDILEIHKRWYELTDTALEIFLTSGKTCLLAFNSAKDRDELLSHLQRLEFPNKRNTINILDALYNWENRNITNFEYLTELNKLAGRSFNDLMQYPIMPFILRDYTSASIDLRDIAIYRDLLKPVSVQDPSNEHKFKRNYDFLKAEFDKYGKEGMTGLRVSPYHYGSHYSNSGSVLHFLVRLPPFTKMFLEFQDQNFDIPDRSFHNVHTSWRLSSAESNTDVKELIPEFFYMHEFLVNNEGFEFGVRQNGDLVNDVVLPPWCNRNARLFTFIHRQALESDHVSENIASWLDLIFGAKQRGEEAVRAINVFHPATYFGLDVSSVKNELDRKAIQTMVQTYGQTPKQLFLTKHPLKKANINRIETQKSGLELPHLKVSGLKWGSYLGSPDCGPPTVGWEQTFTSHVGTLVALPAPRLGSDSGPMFGLSPHCCLLYRQRQEKHSVTVTESPSDVTWVAILTWNQKDGLIRIINNTRGVAINCIQYNKSDEISCCVAEADCRHLFVGGTSGLISVYKTRLNQENLLQVLDQPRCLYGHRDSVNCIVVCKPYSVMVSCSKDRTCIIWDLNRLSYVRSITSHKASVTAVAISNTLGDIVSVSIYDMKSRLHLHTINAELVAMATCEDTIKCLAYTDEPEGVSINLIAGGLSSGVIRLWCSWDLTPIRDLRQTPLIPIVSLAFTSDSQKLYTADAYNRVVMWENTGVQRPRASKFKPYLFPVT